MWRRSFDGKKKPCVGVGLFEAMVADELSFYFTEKFVGGKVVFCERFMVKGEGEPVCPKGEVGNLGIPIYHHGHRWLFWNEFLL